MASVRSEEADHLFQALLTLQSVEECYRFFEDICTIREIESISQRLEVARQLKAGRVYTDIAASTGASTATISRSTGASPTAQAATKWCCSAWKWKTFPKGTKPKHKTRRTYRWDQAAEGKEAAFP